MMKGSMHGYKKQYHAFFLKVHDIVVVGNGQSEKVSQYSRSSGIFAHRMVAATFLKTPPYSNGVTFGVHHLAKRGDKSQNDPRYICWLTHLQNVRQDFFPTLKPDI
jgi:hypothetical protein